MIIPRHTAFERSDQELRPIGSGTAATAKEGHRDLIDDIDALVQQGMSALERQSVEQRSLVLVLGATGVGKSTIVRYLYGDRLRLVIDEGEETTSIESDDAPDAIGNDVLSNTLYPDIADMPGRDYALCDCPGFNDNRSPVHDICGAVTTQYVCDRAASLRAVIVVIEYTWIKPGRYRELKDTARHLQRMFPDFSSFGPSVLFLINKIPENLSEQLVRKKLAPVLDHTDQATRAMVANMLEGTEHLAVCNPLKPESRADLFARIDALVKLLKAKVRLGLSADSLIALNQAIKHKRQAFRERFGLLLEENVVAIDKRISDTNVLAELDVIKQSLHGFQQRLQSIFNVYSLEVSLALAQPGLDKSRSELLVLGRRLARLTTYAQHSPILQVDVDLKSRVHDSLTDSTSLLNKRRIELTLAALRHCFTMIDFRQAAFTRRVLIKQELTTKDFSTVISLLSGAKITSPVLPLMPEVMPVASLIETIEHLGAQTSLLQSIRECVLEPVQLRISRPEPKKGILLVEVRTDMVTMTEILDVVLGYLDGSIQTIQILAPSHIYMDCDLSSNRFSGKNIIICSPTLMLDNQPRKIDVGGHSGDSPADSTASDGEMFGDDGKPGEAGSDASTAGDIVLVVSNILGEGHLTLRSHGGDGGNGQSGGDGKTGKPGDVGPDAAISRPKSSEWLGVWENTDLPLPPSAPKFEGVTLKYFRAGEGLIGGDGGRAGAGGNAGRGSVAGKLAVFGVQSQQIKLDHENGNHGEPGVAGRTGDFGSGGKGGYHGFSRQWQSRFDQSKPDEDQHYVAYFNAGWFRRINGVVHSNEYDDGRALASVWKNYPGVLESLQTSDNTQSADGRAHSGKEGQSGAPGNSGKVGSDEYVHNPELLLNDQALQINELMANLVIRVSFSQRQSNTFKPIRRALLSPTTLSTTFVFVLLTKLEEQLRLELGSERENLYLNNCLALYRDLQNAVLQLNPGEESAGWRFILFAILQKMTFIEERLLGGSQRGNRVVNLVSLTEQIANTLSKARDAIALEKKKQVYNDQFRERIASQIESGNHQIVELERRIDQLIDQSGQDITAMLRNIKLMGQEAENNAKDLFNQRAALETEMRKQMVFTVLKGTLKVGSTLSGAGDMLSSAGDMMINLAENSESTHISIEQLRNTLQHERELAKTNARLAEDSMALPAIDGVNVAERQQALARINAEDLARQKDYDEHQLALAENIIKWESEFADPALPQEQRRQLQKTLQLAGYDVKGKGKEMPDEPDSVDDRMYDDIESQFDIRIDIRKAELDVLRKQAQQATNKRKLKSLMGHSALLEERADRAKRELWVKRAKATYQVGKGIYEVASAVWDISKKFKAEIQETQRAIEAAQRSIEHLIDLHNRTTHYQQTTIYEDLKPFLGSEQSALKNADSFRLSVKKLEFKHKFRNMIAELKDGFSIVNSTASLERTYNDILDVLQTQVEIFEKIEVKLDQRAMGELIYGLSTGGQQKWTEEESAFLKAIELTRLQYLCQMELNAFLLWSFPFGYGSLSGLDAFAINSKDTLEQASRKACAQNDAIAYWLWKGRTMLQGTDNMRLYQTFGIDSPYAQFRFADTPLELMKLLTGEPASFQLPCSDEYSGVKYITLYAYIPQLSKSSSAKKMMVSLQLRGNARFALHFNENTQFYEFAQDPISINHSADVSFNDEGGIRVSVEDRVLKKFKKNDLDTGRSPYSEAIVSISMMVKRSTKRSFWQFLDDQTLTDEFENLFGDSVKIKDSPTMNRIVMDMEEIGWISIKEGVPVIETGLKYSEVHCSSVLLGKSYSKRQANWIKRIMFEQFKVADVDPLCSQIRFVGRGCFVHDPRGILAVSDAYERFRIVSELDRHTIYQRN